MSGFELDHTHDGRTRSWVASANEPGNDFPIQNLPLCSFRERGRAGDYRGGVGIGDFILDLALLSRSRLLPGLAGEAADAAVGPVLNPLLSMGPVLWKALRHGLFDLLREAGAEARSAVAPMLVPQADAKFRVPIVIGGYSDFYTSIYHAVNIGRMMGIEKLAENFRWMPIGYHGRTSTIGISGQQFRRPVGQIRTGEVPELAETAELDYELELAVVVGQGSELGKLLTVDKAEASIFGYSLLNDWSARDIQRWESFPLGPFQSKNFATTVSPWIVTAEALKPYRTPLSRPDGEPAPLPHLTSPANEAAGGIDIRLEVWLESNAHRERELPADRLSVTSFRHQYWTAAQMVTHHTVSGCQLQPGDVLGTGTISGPVVSEAGAMMELALNGSAPFALATGETRSFIQDGDAIMLRGHCEREGFARIGFGECRGSVLPAVTVG